MIAGEFTDFDHGAEVTGQETGVDRIPWNLVKPQ